MQWLQNECPFCHQRMRDSKAVIVEAPALEQQNIKVDAPRALLDSLDAAELVFYCL